MDRPRPFNSFWLLVALLALFAAGKAILYDTLDPDCFWHLRVAEQLKVDGIGPIVDQLSFNSIKTPWTPYSWLAELGMKAVWDAGGYRAAILTAAVMMAGFTFLIALSARQLTRVARRPAQTPSLSPRRGEGEGEGLGFATGLEDKCETPLPNPLPFEGRGSNLSVGRDATSKTNDLAIILALVPALYFSLPFLSFRPVTFALDGLACVTWLILRDRRLGQSKAIFWTIPITVLLINCHFFAAMIPMIFAALLLGDWIQRRPLKRNFYFLICTALACGCTPMLLGTIQTVLHYQMDDAAVNTGLIAECAPIWVGPGRYVTCGLLLAWLISVAATPASPIILLANLNTRRKPLDRHADLGVLFWSLGFFALVLRMSRFLPLFAPIGAATLAASLPVFSGRVLQRKPIAVLLAAVLAIGTVRIATQFPNQKSGLDTWLNRHGPDAPGYPTAAAQFVEAHVGAGRVINEFSWGGYLAWRLGQSFPVFSDGRTQLYSGTFWRKAFIDPSFDSSLIEQSHASAAIVSANSRRLRGALTQLGWTSAYRDDRAEVLVPPASLTNAN